ncbi:hypothetical protein ACFWFF_01455 [Streptomyces sp. NPDC060223]|uniref:hypothetical protein n=1 Tax=unclassified Streptomyces TaxID=2593676 RepID=UPI00363BC711
MHERATEPVRIPELTAEQREQMLRSVAAVTAGLRQVAEAFVPVVAAAAQQFTQIAKALQDAGYLDEEYKPIQAADRPAQRRR